MRFEPTTIAGVMIVHGERHADKRGSFDRVFCREAFAETGIELAVVQANVSRNPQRGTLRGIHFQREPHGESKLVSCTAGRIWDVAVDVRADSPTFRHWVATELSPTEPRSFYLAAGIAHGFLTLEPDSEVSYLMGAPYVAAAAAGLRWNDPALTIEWPSAPALISERDRSFPLLG
jgi:dTDP-4-dehydrorhamnose 3,5-epimerase